MKNIAILLDSTSGLTLEASKEFDNIFMIPLYFIFGDESYKDGIDLNVKEFLKKSEELYEKSGILPTTSQPAIGECIDMYKDILKDFDEIVYITISQKMSGTYQSGVLAAEEFDGKVTVIDSKTTSFGTYIPGVVAANLAKEGKDVAEIVEVVNKIIEESEVYFVVSDLKHLQRTGRIGAAAATIGNALQLKPVLTIANGEVTQYEKVRNVKKAHKKIVSYFEEKNLTENDLICITGADADEYEAFIKGEVLSLFPNIKIMREDLSPVIAVNTGPGTTGLFVFKNISELKV